MEQILGNLPPIPPVVPYNDTNGSVLACQKKENPGIKHVTSEALLLEEEKGYRTQALVQWLGIRNSLRGFVENYVFGNFADARDYYIQALLACNVFHPKGEELLKFKRKWQQWINACVLLAKYVKRHQGTEETRERDWKCCRCNEWVQTDGSKDVTMWDCNACYIRAPIVQHLFLVCHESDEFKDLIFKMVRVGIIDMFESTDAGF